MSWAVRRSLNDGSMLSYQIRENVKTAQFKVRTRQENVSGVMLPAFEKWHEGNNGTVLGMHGV